MRKLIHRINFMMLLLVFFPQILSANSASPYSNQELEQLEKEFVEQINLSNSVIRYPLASQYINHIGKMLAQQGQMQPSFFFLVNSNEINAFAGPGGYIGVNSELILASDNESELAAVMAHELAHVRQHHLYHFLEHQKQMRIPMLASMLAAMALGVVTPGIGPGAIMATMSGFAQDNINFIRSNEKEADRIGIDMLIKAGFNPKGMAGFFKKMMQNSQLYGSANLPTILRTHPLDADRIAEAENRSERLVQKDFHDSADYGLFKELIRTSVVQGDSQLLLEYYRNQCEKKNTHFACQYGLALTFNNMNQYAKAYDTLHALIEQEPSNLYTQIAASETEIGLKAYQKATSRMKEIFANFPTNYAVTMAYANTLLASQNTQQAASILLKGSRRFKNDLQLCEKLAEAQAKSGHKAHAYFTEAQCELLQGQKQIALRQLKLAEKLAKKEPYLSARIAAKIEEIKAR